MTRQEFKNLLSERILFLDGAMGSFLIDAGLQPGQAPEEFNLLKPEAVIEAHRGYVEAGSDVILTNTFGGSGIKLGEFGLSERMGEINLRAAELAREAVKNSDVLVAGSIGPCGRYLPPIGSLGFDDAVFTFREQAHALQEGGVDLIVVETISDIREMRACLVGIREVFDGPIIAHMTFTDGYNTITGTDPETAAAIIEAFAVDALGVNCTTGPREMYPLVEQFVRSTHLPVSVEPNAGMPRIVTGMTVYPEPPEVLAEFAVKFADIGANILGACCGSSPAHIKAIIEAVGLRKPLLRDVKPVSCLCSRDKTVRIEAHLPSVIIGERINPTGRKKFREALAGGNMSPVRSDAVRQVREGAAVLDVNMGVPGENEAELMRKAVRTIQAAVNVPLCLDSSKIEALEAGLKEVEGKPLVNSVTAEDDRLNTILPLVKKFGAAVIGLPLNENGIPDTADGRLILGNKILQAVEKEGIPRTDLYLDGLTMTVSADVNAPKVTLETIRRFKQELGVKTVLGVSNVSHGLPNRSLVNGVFLTLALEAGLDLAIINPYSQKIIDAVYAGDLLLGRDSGSRRYIRHASTSGSEAALSIKAEQNLSPEERLKLAVMDGNSDEAVEILTALLQAGIKPMELNDNILIPAMMLVGQKYNKKEIFLPQVIQSAETMHAAFAALKPHLTGGKSRSKGRIILATVKGDVHDIGKNIVATLVENHGYEVIDLGKNIGTQQILEAIDQNNADIVGMSALMTTTMEVMKDMVKEIKASSEVKIIVGGAVVTRNFAEEIGADGYAKDASEAPNEIAGILG